MSRRSDAGRGALEDIHAARQPARAPAGDPVGELEVILERVRRLRYDHNNPERFHAERSDVAGAIGGLVKRMRVISSTASIPDVLTISSARAAMNMGPPKTARRSLGRPILHLKDHG